MDIAAMIASKTGLSPELCQKGLGVILVGLRKFAPDLYTQVSGYLPESGEAEAAYNSAEASDSGGGIMGTLGGLASKVMGGDAGDAGELMQMFGKAGFSPAQAKEFAGPALESLKSKLPPELVDQVCESVPGLKTVS